MKKRALFIITGLWIAALTGCGQEEVIYGEDTALEQGENIDENHASGTIRDLLEMGDEEVWEETIEGKEETIRVKAKIKVPDAANFSTMTATKYYLTKEDKKRIAEYFMDADTIKVDTRYVFTKEQIQEQIDYSKESIEEFSVTEPLDFNKLRAGYEERCMEKLEQQLASAPNNSDEIKEEPEDYSANHYIGSRGNVEYSLDFEADLYADAPSDICSWSLSREEDESTQSSTNKETITQQQACSQAERICEELGLADMMVINVEDYAEEDISLSYVIELVRGINGVEVDGNPYGVLEPYNEEETAVTPYKPEKVRIGIDALGVSFISCENCMKGGEIGDTVKLLSYSQILEVFRRELETMETEKGEKSLMWMRLELSYLRVADESDPNLFYYIPVWRLGRRLEDSYLTTDNIWINAIDGSRIYPEEVGAAEFYAYWYI